MTRCKWNSFRHFRHQRNASCTYVFDAAYVAFKVKVIFKSENFDSRLTPPLESHPAMLHHHHHYLATLSLILDSLPLGDVYGRDEIVFTLTHRGKKESRVENL